MSKPVTLYITSHETGELLGTREAHRDIKNPKRVVFPPYHTPVPHSNEALKKGEYWALLDANGKPVRDFRNGAWIKEQRLEEVTTYLKTDCCQSKEFADKTLVTSDYTLKKPKTPFDEWNSGKWVTNKSNKYIAEYNQVDDKRRTLYSQMCDPLKMEAMDLMDEGKEAEALQLKQQALAAKQKIKTENPWPTPPEN